jgi:hypothetical protein
MKQRNAQLSEKTVFWRHASGELMLAIDPKIRPKFPWYRIECLTAQETERYSREMARQEFNKFKHMKVEEHLRSRAKRQERIANCKLRLASGCISALDEQITRNTLKSFELKEELFYKFLTEEPDLTRASLMIERYEAPQLKSMKKTGLRDEEVDMVNKLVQEEF